MAPVMPSITIPPFVIGFILSLAVSLTARALRWLTTDGVIAAVGVGTLVLGFGGWPQAGLLVFFFATSSALTRWQAARKPHLEHAAGRTAGQVLANGAVATVLSVWGAMHQAPWIALAFAGAIAASTADTWATEIGLLAASPPRLLTTGQIVARGQSGAVTWQGTLAACVGAAGIAGLANLWIHTPLLPIWTAGTAAMLLDSLLGASVEGRQIWMTNDAVNLLAAAAGASLAAVLGAV
jgi:uncharacterized protein (TIGR00297 family)